MVVCCFHLRCQRNFVIISPLAHPSQTMLPCSAKAQFLLVALFLIRWPRNGRMETICCFFISPGNMCVFITIKHFVKLQWMGHLKWFVFVSRLLHSVPHPRDPFYYYVLTLTLAWISNYMSSKVWNEITYPFLNFNGATVEVWKSISDCISNFIIDVITYLWLNHIS